MILFTPFIEKVGYYCIIRASFVLRILGSLFMFVSGPDPNRLVGFFLFDRYQSESNKGHSTE